MEMQIHLLKLAVSIQSDTVSEMELMFWRATKRAIKI